MKKVLVVFDGSIFPEASLDFAKQWHEPESLVLTGIFLPKYDYASFLSYSAGG